MVHSGQFDSLEIRKGRGEEEQEYGKEKREDYCYHGSIAGKVRGIRRGKKLPRPVKEKGMPSNRREMP